MSLSRGDVAHSQLLVTQHPADLKESLVESPEEVVRIPWLTCKLDFTADRELFDSMGVPGLGNRVSNSADCKHLASRALRSLRLVLP